VDQKMGGRPVQLLNLHAELLGDHARREAEAHLKRRDYAALEQTLRQSRLGEPWHQQLCAYAECRTRFDFRGAREALERARRELQSGEVHARVGQFLEELQPFLKETTPSRSASSSEEWEEWFKLQRELLAELFFNLRRKVLQGEWVDFLSRLFRLQEAVLRLVFEMETNHSTYKHKGAEFADFSQVITGDAALSKWFTDNAIRFEEPNSRNLFQALRYWVEKGGKGRKYGKLYNAVKVIGDAGLQELRNQSIAAHGYQGVSQADVESKAQKSVEELLDLVKQVISGLEGNVDRDPYDAIDGPLRQAL
jgi:CRISPR-associated protein (Cas_Cas02710)